MIGEISLLKENLRRAFDQRSWHGPNLMGSIRGVTPDEAAWRPQPERHNIWEYVVHAAYWKYRVVRRLDAGAADAFSLAGSNFFERPVESTKPALKQDIELLRDWHGQLMEVVNALEPTTLSDSVGEFDKRALILGAAAHDVYHAGQIRLLRRMWDELSFTSSQASTSRAIRGGRGASRRDRDR